MNSTIPKPPQITCSKGKTWEVPPDLRDATTVGLLREFAAARVLAAGKRSRFTPLALEKSADFLRPMPVPLRERVIDTAIAAGWKLVSPAYMKPVVDDFYKEFPEQLEALVRGEDPPPIAGATKGDQAPEPKRGTDYEVRTVTEFNHFRGCEVRRDREFYPGTDEPFDRRLWEGQSPEERVKFLESINQQQGRNGQGADPR